MASEEFLMALEKFVEDPNDRTKEALESSTASFEDMKIVTQALGALADSLRKMKEPPLEVGVAVSEPWIGKMGGQVVLVSSLQGGSMSYCAVHPKVSPRKGDRVGLTRDGGLVVNAFGPLHAREIASVRRVLPDGKRLLVYHEGKDLLVETAASLWLDPNLKPGVKVLVDSGAGIATDIYVDEDAHSKMVLTNIPDLSWGDFGGFSDVKEKLSALEELLLATPEELAKQALEKRLMVLFSGRPGTGKTYAAQILCASLRRRLGTDKVAYVFIRAAELLNPYVGVSESNIRDRFAHVRLLAEQGAEAVVMVWDEFEGLFAARGARAGSVITDRTIVPTLLSELDGVGNQLRSFLMVGITNRPDLIDSAILRQGRVGEEIHFRGPGREEAVEIFSIHLRGRELAHGTTLPEVAEWATSRIFDGPAVANITLRRGDRVTLSREELTSGATIAGVCETSGRRAWLRGRKDGGGAGLRLDDLGEAIDGAFTSIASRLTPRNLWDYVDWPETVLREVVSVS